MPSIRRKLTLAFIPTFIACLMIQLGGCNMHSTEPSLPGVTQTSSAWVDVEKENHSSLHISGSTMMPTTTIEFALPGDAIVTLTVHDSRDIEVEKLLDHAQLEAGIQEVSFDASGLSSGVYIYTLIAQGVSPEGELTGTVFVDSRKMMLLK